jgi:general secretion pathway protein K
MPAPERRDKGFALLLVLWVIALLTVLAFSLSFGTRTQAKIDRNQYDKARAQTSADAGVNLAILGILGRTSETRWRLDGSPRELTFGDTTIRVKVQNEAGKMDLNYAGKDVLAGLLRTLGSEAEAAEGLAAAVVDWKNRRRSRWRQMADNAPGSLQIGEVQPFLALEDLRTVTGVTPEIYDRASPFLTILSGSDRVDPLSAPREVLLSLPSANLREVDAYIAARAEIGPDPAALPGLDSISAYFKTGLVAYVTISSESKVAGARFIRDATVSFVTGGTERFRFVTWQQGRGGEK